MNAVWEKIQINLEKQLKPGIFQVWVRPLQGHFADNTLLLTAPTKLVATYVQEKLLQTIKQTAAETLGTLPEISITSKHANHKNISLPKSKYLPLGNPSPFPKTFKWQYCFDDFLVGPCNHLAFAACKSICEQKLPTETIFLSSGPGLGKTHLLHAIGCQLTSLKKRREIRVAYISSEKFANQMIAALKRNTIQDFKSRYRDQVDFLLLEDVHFFQGKPKMQQELLALIKDLEAKGKKVVFSSSFLPKELHKIDNQLTSHFCSGLMAPIQRPEQDFMAKLIAFKCKKINLRLSEPTIKYIASNIKPDIRQLESCLKNIALRATTLGCKPTLELATETLQNYSLIQVRPDLETIIESICQNFSLSKENLRSRSRKKQYVLARNTAFFLARKYTDLSLKDIGTRFNRRHSTVIKGITNIERELKEDTKIGRQVSKIMDKLEN